MDETNLTPRQRAVLNVVNQSKGLSREDIQKKIEPLYAVSRATIIRDLNILLHFGLIRVVGKGKNSLYLTSADNQILRVIDLKQYFLVEADQRSQAKKRFDFDIYHDLNGLILNADLVDIQKVQKSFSKQTKKMTPDVVAKELERFVIELSWKSSKIEGNTYTLLETERLIRESKEAQGKSKDEALMILNHKIAFDQILKHAGDFQTLTVPLINQLHNTLVIHLNIQTGIRSQAVGITGTVYQPLDNQHQLKEAMKKTMHAININPSPLEKALIALAMISYIQPYTDGNKRTARMLTNAILLAHDCYPLSYRSIDEDEFKQSLILFYEQGSIFHLKRLFLSQLRFAYTTYFQ